MKDFLKWLVAHSLHWAVLYGAFAAQLDGAMYVLKFWVWLMAPLSLFLLVAKVTEEEANRPPQPVRSALNFLQAWVTLGLLVWFGHIATALAWGLAMLMFAAYRDAVKKARNKEADK